MHGLDQNDFAILENLRSVRKATLAELSQMTGRSEQFVEQTMVVLFMRQLATVTRSWTGKLIYRAEQ